MLTYVFSNNAGLWFEGICRHVTIAITSAHQGPDLKSDEQQRERSIRQQVVAPDANEPTHGYEQAEEERGQHRETRLETKTKRDRDPATPNRPQFHASIIERTSKAEETSLGVELVQHSSIVLFLSPRSKCLVTCPRRSLGVAISRAH